MYLSSFRKMSEKDQGEAVFDEIMDDIFLEFIKNMSLDLGNMPKAKQGK